MKSQGRIILITGDGKGKTTSALGTLLRAWGHGYRVAFIQFVKSRKDTGELLALQQLGNVECLVLGYGFLREQNIEIHRDSAHHAWEEAKKRILSGQYDLIVLDEILFAVHKQLLEEEEIIQTLRQKPSFLTVILTGRGATPELINIADTVSEIRSIKHAFEQGMGATKGVEW